MKKKVINAAIIGCGRVADHYLKVIRKYKITNLRIIAICDKNSKKLNLFAKYFKAKKYLNYKELFKNEVLDLVFILTPSGLHYLHSKYALLQNVNVLTEKPMTMLPSKTIELNNLAKKKKLMYGVVFQNRFNPSIQALKYALLKNRFGKLINISINIFWCRYQNYYSDDWHGTWKNDGGVLNQQAIHHVDILNWLFGPIEYVFGISSNQINKLEAEDTIAVVFKSSKKFTGTIQATTAVRPKDFEASIKVFGENGMVEIGGIALNKILRWEFKKKKIGDKTIYRKNVKVINGYGWSHSTVIKETIKRMLKNNFKPLIGALEAEKTGNLVHSIYKSCEIWLDGRGAI